MAEARLHHQAGTDALANGRLNQQLSWEICREYTTQQRKIPKLAIRFGVPPRHDKKRAARQKMGETNSGHTSRCSARRTTSDSPTGGTTAHHNGDTTQGRNGLDRRAGRTALGRRTRSPAKPALLHQRTDEALQARPSGCYCRRGTGLRQKLTANLGRHKARSTISEKIAKFA